MNKKMKFQKAALLIAVLLVGSTIYAQHDHGNHQKQKMDHGHEHEHKMSPTFESEQFTIAYNSYTLVNEALASDNANEAKKGASQLFELLEGIPDGGIAQQEAKKLSGTKSIKEQREIFVKLSDEVAKLVKANNLSKGEVFLAYCPMANNNEGAYWLSNGKEIKNPYMGSKMLKCGSVKETIK